MNEGDDKEFWAKLGAALRRPRPQAYWEAQRARITERLAEPPRPFVRPWVAAPALAGLAVAALIALWPEPPDVPVGVPRAPVAWDARITSLQGQATVFPNGKSEGVPAATGMPVEKGDEIHTGSDGRVELALSSEGVVELEADTRMAVANLDQKHTLLDLDLGTLVAKLQWLKAENRGLKVRTPTMVAAVRGTEFGVSVAAGGDSSVAVYDEGIVAVRAMEAPAVEETLLQPRQEVRVPRGAQPESEAREGRSFLRPAELSELKPFRERVEHIRGRHEELRREWTELPRPRREELRGRMFREEEQRMSLLPPPEREAARERLRRPGRGERGPGSGPGPGLAPPPPGGPGGERPGPGVERPGPGGGERGQGERRGFQGRRRPGGPEERRPGRDKTERRGGESMRERGREPARPDEERGSGPERFRDDGGRRPRPDGVEGRPDREGPPDRGARPEREGAQERERRRGPPPRDGRQFPPESDERRGDRGPGGRADWRRPEERPDRRGPGQGPGPADGFGPRRDGRQSGGDRDRREPGGRDDRRGPGGPGPGGPGGRR